MTIGRIAARVPIALAALAALASGIAIGLARLGIAVPLAAPHAAAHGTLMICAFFGTVIGLERAVALGRGWALLAPAAAALGGIALLGRAPQAATGAAFLVAAVSLLAVSAAIVKRQAALHTTTLALGAAAWLAGVLAWIAADIAAAVPFWLSFLVLTIAGERLELTRVLPPARGARGTFVALVLALVACATLVSMGVASGPFGATLGALALWLARHDVARRTVRQRGLTRYIAICLLAGYAWLALGGLLGAGGALDPGARLRDTALHALGLGFVVSMVFGHAPIIVPALTGVRVAWTAAFYAPLALLHVSLVMRAAGDVAASPPLARAGAIGNAAAIALFAMTVIAAAARARNATARPEAVRT